MDILLELLFEIIIEGSLELGTTRKVPLPLRILALIIVLFVYGFLLFIIFMIGYDAAKEGNTGVAGMMYVTDALLFILVVYAIRKKFKENRNDKDE